MGNVTSHKLLPSATKSGQGNIFRSMCQKFCPWGRHAWQGGMGGGGGACVAREWVAGGTCMAGGHVYQGSCHAWLGSMCGRGHVWQGGVHGRGCAWQGPCMAGGVYGRYYEIRSMSRRYASHWNAFLLRMLEVLIRLFSPILGLEPRVIAHYFFTSTKEILMMMTDISYFF